MAAFGVPRIGKLVLLLDLEECSEDSSATLGGRLYTLLLRSDEEMDEIEAWETRPFGRSFDDKWKDHREIAQVAVARRPAFFRYFSDRLKADTRFVERALLAHRDVYTALSEDQQRQQRFGMLALLGGCWLRAIHADLRGDRTFVTWFLQQEKQNKFGATSSDFHHIAPDLWLQPEIYALAFARDPVSTVRAASYVPGAVRQDDWQVPFLREYRDPSMVDKEFLRNVEKHCPEVQRVAIFGSPSVPESKADVTAFLVFMWLAAADESGRVDRSA
jgi:hypothetical protein